ncbi:DUF3311 domain-containing protein [Streptomyces daliensis]
MSPTTEDGGLEGPQEPGPLPFDELPAVRPRRHALWLLLVPAALYCAAPLVANRVEPRVLGIPFLLFWVIAATVISPFVIWLTARLDPAYRTNAIEPIPADGAETGSETGKGDVR